MATVSTPIHPGAVNPFVSGRWVMEAKPQNIWGAVHATWFSAMGLGGALFIMRAISGIEMGRVLGMSVADLLSLVVIGIAGLILISDLGRPMYFWRVYRNPRTSWISIGFMADMIFMGFAGLWTLADLDLGAGRLLGWLPWAGNSPLGVVFQAIAVLAAIVVILYPGLVLASSPSIPFWNNMMAPLEYLAGAFASALGVAYLSTLWAPMSGADLVTMARVGFVLVAILGLLLGMHLLSGHYSGTAGRISARRLVSGDLKGYFLGGAVLLNVLLPALLIGISVPGQPVLPLLLLAGVLLQVGNWFTKYSVIKAGVYPPFI